jgi:hypothetical protein
MESSNKYTSTTNFDQFRINWNLNKRNGYDGNVTRSLFAFDVVVDGDIITYILAFLRKDEKN